MIKNYQTLLITALTVLSSSFAFSQLQQNFAQQNPHASDIPGRTCGTGILSQQYEEWVKTLQSASPGKGGGGNTESVLKIPVIVHIIHNNEAVNTPIATIGNNLNAAQIIDQIAILNKDYNGTNADTATIQAVFKAKLGKMKMSFCLAVVNPTGGVLAEAGIDRINRVAKGWNNGPYNPSYVDATIKPNSIWDPTRYLNIWVCELGSSLLGYATFPSPSTTGLQGLTSNIGTPTTDGIVVLNKAFGSVGTAAVYTPYHKGRTATHEIGHWVGLRHVDGDQACGDDFCADTPTQQALNFGCVSFPNITCSNGPNGDMFMNFLDYGDDLCLKMFSQTQVYRMQLIMANSPLRLSLLTSTVCNLISVTNDIGLTHVISPTFSDVVNCNPSINPIINVHNFGSNVITSATFTFNVDGVGTQTLNWAGSLAPNTSSAISLPQINGLSNGFHSFAASVLNPNSVADSDMSNNYSFQPFSIVNGYTFAALGATTICSGNNATLTATGAATSYTWNPSNITGTSAVVAPPVTTIYSLSGTFLSCVKIVTVQVTVNATPTLVANSTTICTSGTATLIVSGATTYSWSTTQTTQTINVSPASQTVYTVTGVNGICGSAKTVTVSIGTNLGIIAAGTPPVYCVGGASTLNATGASAYTWQPGNLNGASINVNPTTSTTYTIVGTSAACSGTSTVLLTVNPIPAVSAFATNSLICMPSPGTNLNGFGAATYSWQPGNLVGAVVAINPSSNTTYTVIGQSGAGCTQTQVVNVVVFTKPTVNLATSTPTICQGDVGSLFAVGAASYIWNPGSLSGANVTVSPSSSTTYTVGGTTSGCTDTKTISISVFPCVGLTNFTSANFQVLIYPNPFKDELSFKISEEVKIEVYNAIGQVVKTETISREGKMSTSDMPNGVYFIHVKGYNEKRVYKVVKN